MRMRFSMEINSPEKSLSQRSLPCKFLYPWTLWPPNHGKMYLAIIGST
jgi:hypothetical protein